MLPFGSLVAILALGQMLVIMVGGIDLSMAASISLLANILVGVSKGANGRLGLTQFAASKPSLILLDLMMPEMDGFEFLELLRGDAAFSNIPVVVMTTTDLSEADRRRLNSGIVEFVSKAACDRDELLARIRDFVMHNVPISGMQRQVERDG